MELPIYRFVLHSVETRKRGEKKGESIKMAWKSFQIREKEEKNQEKEE